MRPYGGTDPGGRIQDDMLSFVETRCIASQARRIHDGVRFPNTKPQYRHAYPGNVPHIYEKIMRIRETYRKFIKKSRVSRIRMTNQYYRVQNAMFGRVEAYILVIITVFSYC